MHRRLPILALLLLAVLVAGCGGKYQLPTEHRAVTVSHEDKSYAMFQTWKGLNGIQDIMLTQGVGSSLFMLFNTGGTGGPDVPRGEVRLYARELDRNRNPVVIAFQAPRTLFNPVALCPGPRGFFVLDQGDSCMAKYDDVRGTCEADPTPVTPTTTNRRSQIRNYRATWRVREYPYNDSNVSYTGDTASTFTDTSFVQVFGIAADPQGRVYVSGVAALLDTSAIDQHVRERHFTYRVFRYERGSRYTGLNPDSLNWDPNMPGCQWHRDTTWYVGTGTGTGFVTDPRGIAWSNAGSPSLFVSDRGNQQAKTISPNAVSTGYVSFDGSDSPEPFVAPEAVATDLAGFLYVVDRGARRVVRYDPYGQWVQDVNIQLNSDDLPLLDPIAVGVDDSATYAYVGDRGRGQVIRYERRK